jgi:HSP20 family protein
MTLIKFKNDRLNTPRVFNNFIEDFFNSDFSSFKSPLFGSTPHVNVAESKDSFRIELALPGVNKENISINVEGNLLTVSGKNENKVNEENESYTRREFSFSTFSRTFTLPETVNADAISADYTDGILKVSVPKKEEAKDKGAKSIKIS